MSRPFGFRQSPSSLTERKKGSGYENGFLVFLVFLDFLPFLVILAFLLFLEILVFLTFLVSLVFSAFLVFLAFLLCLAFLAFLAFLAGASEPGGQFIVFYGSAKETNNEWSLNDHLLNGPNFIPTIFDLLVSLKRSA